MIRNIVLYVPALALISLLACGQKPAPAKAAAPTSDLNEVAMKPLAEPPKAGLWLIEPKDGGTVTYRPVIVGTISDSTVRSIWVVVRAKGMPDYWVQPMAALRNDGMWICQPYVGLTDTKAGVAFELRAVAEPKPEVRSGEKLAGWPEGRYVSEVVTVARQ